MGLTDAFFRSKTSVADHEALARLTLALWRALTTGFRPDEQSVEGARFTEQTSDIDRQLSALPAAQLPDAALCRRMLEALTQALSERVGDLHERIDELAATCRARDRELTTQKLAGSWQSDELERCRTMLVQQLRGRETVMPGNNADGTAPLISHLLATFLHISAPPPRPEASVGRRASATEESSGVHQRIAPAPLDPGAGERAVIVQVLREVLDGTAQSPRLMRALEDADLAKRLADLAAEHRTYRGILQQIGVLPKE